MSTEYLTPTTELQAVNSLLRSIQESPVTILDDSFVDAQSALDLIREVSRDLQGDGWSFNTETSYPLPLNSDGRAVIPPTAVNVQFPENSTYTQRGQYVYDTDAHSYVFMDAPTATVVFCLPFDELPEQARRFIVTAAKRRFQKEVGGDLNVVQVDARDEARAWAEFLNSEAEWSKLNVLTGSSSISRVLQAR